MKVNMGKVVFACILMCMVSIITPLTVAASGDYDGKTVVIVTGNLRGQINVLPYVAAIRADFQARGAEVVLADSGNFLQGTRYTSFNSGSTMISMMSAAGYDVFALGTYDFAFGTGAISAARMAELHGDIVDFGPLGLLIESHPSLHAVSANIVGANDFFYDFTPNFVMGTEQGLNLAFFGITDPATADLILASHLAGISFADPSAAALSQAEALSAYDVVIGLSNVSIEAAPDVIVMETIATPIPGTFYIRAIVIDNATHEYEIRTLDIDDFTADAELDALVTAFKAEVSEAFPWTATSVVMLDGSGSANRSGETALGNLWADALRWFAVSGEINAFFGEDDVDAGNDRIHVADEYIVALWNAGNLRDFLHPGEIMMQDLRRVLPFPNTVAVVYLTGAELLEQLEASAQGLPFSADTYTLTASLMHVSGIEYSVDVRQDFVPGVAYRDRIWYTAADVVRVTIHSVNGRPFDAAATYAVITSNANFNGMDISYVLAARESDVENLSTITTARVVDHAVAGFISTLPNATIDAEQAVLQGRITVVDAADSAVLTPPEESADEGASDDDILPPGTALYALNISGIADNGNLLFAVRAVADVLGAAVSWDSETGIAVINTADGMVFFAYADEHFIINDRLFVSADDIMRIFGVQVIDGNLYIYHQ